MASSRKKASLSSLRSWIGKIYKTTRERTNSYLGRRPHRSFRPTRRRDLPKRANLPGNIIFTTYVVGFVRQNKQSFIILVLIYLISYTLIAGTVSQDNYQLLTESVQNFGSNLAGGEVSKSTETFILLATTMAGGLGSSLSEMQQTYVGFLYLFMWLAIIWLSRHRFNAVKVKVRDALYNAGAPLLPTILVTLLAVVQLLPAAIAVLLYTTLYAVGAIEEGALAMLFGLGAFLLVVLSAYWLVSTFIALIVVTVPGTYPMQSIKLAGDIVIGRRTQVLLRLLWMVLCVIALWVIVLVPTILVAGALPWEWLPLVPIAVQLLNVASFIFVSVYIYILYRGMIDESLVPDAR